MNSKGECQLTDEQLMRMEMNRIKALQRRTERSLLSKTNQAVVTGSSNCKTINSPTYVQSVKSIATKTKTSNSSMKVDRLIETPKKIVVQGQCVILSRERFRIEVGFHKELIEICKTIPSKIYDPVEKKWNFLIEHHNQLMNAVLPLKPTVLIKWLPPATVKLFLTFSPKQELSEVDLSSLDPALCDSLMPFQRIGVSFGLARNGRVLIADDMGLGKTIQAIAIADFYRSEWPLLVVTPSSMRYSWLEAFHTWVPSLDDQQVTVINTSKDHLGHYKVYITSYDLMTRRLAELESKAFKVVIMDESHHLKNFRASRTKAAHQIVAYANRLILLSGTPALSKPSELYPQISMIDKKAFPKFQDFGIRYCDGKMGPWGWDYSGASHTTELLLIMEEKVMIRRLKTEVMKQLPEKLRQMVILDPTEIATNQKNMSHCSQMLSNSKIKGLERRGMLLTYYHETASAKSKAVCNYISDLLVRGEKFLCFAHHQLMMDSVCSLLDQKKVDYVRIDGYTLPQMRKQNVDRFQFQDNCLVAVLSITAASTGITLTSARLVVFAELFWNPGILTQAEDRVHRIGQESSVLIQYLVAKGTADDHLWLIVRNKLDVLSKVGLSKDNFQEADTKTLGSKMKIMNFFETLEDCQLDDLDDISETPLKRHKTA